MIETTISKDVLLLTPVQKPALLRRVFDLACRYSGQELSYQKMMGQLSGAGNNTSLALYLELLEGAGMVCGLQKYAGQAVRQRAQPPRARCVLHVICGRKATGAGHERRATAYLVYAGLIMRAWALEPSKNQFLL